MKTVLKWILGNLPIVNQYLKGSWYTTLLGYLAIAGGFLAGAQDVIVNFAAFIDADPLTVVDSVALQAALEKFGIGAIGGFIGLGAKDKDVSTEEQLEADGKKNEQELPKPTP